MKNQIRLKAKDIRHRCSLSEKEKAQFKEHLFSILPNHKIIAGYDAMQSELDLSFLNLDFVFPIIEKNTRLLSFNAEPDIFLVPLLAFDEEGYRIGYGGGYYDATLKHYRQQKNISAIGIAFEAQKWQELLPREPHDQRLDYIVTEEKIRCF